MKVLHMIGSLDYGGSQILVTSILEFIDINKIQFDFIIDRPDELALYEKLKKYNCKVFVIPRFKGFNLFQYIKSWITFFKEHPEYEIIHGHVRSTAAIYLFIAKKFGLITIAHSHSIASGLGVLSLIKNILQFPIRFIADYFIGCTYEAGVWLFGKKICNENNFFILKNGINLSDYVYNHAKRDYLRKQLNIDSDTIVIGHIGRFQPEKNHMFILNIFEEFHKHNNKALLMFLGDGKLKNTCIEYVKLHSLNKNVIFFGNKDNVGDYLQIFDIFLFPSLYEGLGIALIEAQASDLYCLISDTIPKEAILTDRVYSMSLNQSSYEWSSKIIELTSKIEKRFDITKQIKTAGYDIKESANWLSEFYFTIKNERKINQ